MDDKRKRQALAGVQHCLEKMGEILQSRGNLITKRDARLAEVCMGRLFDDDFQSHEAWLCYYFPANLVYLEKMYLQLGVELEAREASLESGKDFESLICHTDPEVPKALEEQKKASMKLYEEAYSEYQKVVEKKAEEATAEWEKEKKEAAPVLDEAAYEAQLLEASKTAFAAAKAKAAFKAAVEAPVTKEGEGTTSGGKEYAFHVKRPPPRRTAAAGESFVMVNMPSGVGVSVNSGDWAPGVPSKSI